MRTCNALRYYPQAYQYEEVENYPLDLLYLDPDSPHTFAPFRPF